MIKIAMYDDGHNL